ncbi:MAG: hypothetical protein ACPGQS_06025 [Bradymonadia bacterium]
MLIDFIMRSDTQDPKEMVDSLVASGIQGVVYDVNDQPLNESIEESDLVGYGASVFKDDGAALIALAETATNLTSDSVEEWVAEAQSCEALIIASHPYDRSQGRPWGDRIYRISGLTHIVTSAASNESSREQLALTVAKKKNVGKLSASMTNANLQGQVGTMLKVSSSARAEVCDALREHALLGIRMESADTPYVEPIEPSPRSSSRSNDRGRSGRRDQDRGGRRQRRGSGRR